MTLSTLIWLQMLRHAVDPAPAQAHVDRLFGRDRLQARPHSVDPDPDLVFLVVVHGEPPVELDGGLERLDVGGIDFDGRHQETRSRRGRSPGVESGSPRDDVLSFGATGPPGDTIFGPVFFTVC